MTVAEARALGEAAMRGAGYGDDDARILTTTCWTRIVRYEYSGLPKLLNVVDAPHFRQPRRPVTLLRETGQRPCSTAATITAWSRPTRTEATIERAEASGLALCARQHLDDRT